MKDPNLPHDTSSAEMCLKQRKLILLEIHAEVLNKEFTQAWEVTGLINDVVENIDSRLESGDLWEEGSVK